MFQPAILCQVTFMDTVCSCLGFSCQFSVSQRWALDPELIQINYPSVVITKKYCQCKRMGSSAISFTHLWRAWHSIVDNFNSEAIRNEYPNIPLHTRNVYVLTFESADKTLLRSWKHSKVGIPHNQKRMADNHVMN